MEYPKIVKEAAQWYIERFGERLSYIGTRNGYAFYKFSLPDGQELGFPPVYKTDGCVIEEIYGIEAMHIINSFL